MAIAESELTAEYLLAESAGMRCELVEGALIKTSPAGWELGIVSMSIGAKLFSFVDSKQLGQCFAAETGFLIAQDPDTVRAPDAAFVRQERLATVDQSAAFLSLAPDLVVEVISDSDIHCDVQAKVYQWLDCGTSVVWVLQSDAQQVTVYEGRDLIRVLEVAEKLTCEQLLPGFEVAVADLFSNMQT